jgi:hypothetical protein
MAPPIRDFFRFQEFGSDTGIRTRILALRGTR